MNYLEKLLEYARPHLMICATHCRSYATAICELLDPTKELFGQRIIAQTANAVTSDERAQANAAKRLLEACSDSHGHALAACLDMNDVTSNLWMVFPH